MSPSNAICPLSASCLVGTILSFCTVNTISHRIQAMVSSQVTEQIYVANHTNGDYEKIDKVLERKVEEFRFGFGSGLD